MHLISNIIKYNQTKHENFLQVMLPGLRICNHQLFLNISYQAAFYHCYSSERRNTVAVTHKIAEARSYRYNFLDHKIAGPCCCRCKFLGHTRIENSHEVNHPMERNLNVKKKSSTSNFPPLNSFPPWTKLSTETWQSLFFPDRIRDLIYKMVFSVL